MAGAGRIKFESFNVPRKDEQALRLIQNMIKAGSPVVNRGGVMSRIVVNETGFSSQAMSKDTLAAEFARTTDYLVEKRVPEVKSDGEVKKDDKGRQITKVLVDIGDVPQRVINIAYGMMNSGDGDGGGLWPLRGTLTHPIVNERGEIVIHNGLNWREEDRKGVMVKVPALHLFDGYDPASEYFFALSERVLAAMEGVRELTPGVKDVVGALETIDDFLTDFEFASKSAKASAVAFMLTMVCRDIITDRVPMAELRAAESQSGKTILGSMMVMGVTGEAVSMFVPNFKNEDEFRKQLFTQLARGRNYIFMDNVYGRVQSDFLDSCLTTPSLHISDRVLGTHLEATYYCGMPFLMTANNPTLSDDMKNRIYLLDINKPADSKKYRHPRWKTYAVEQGPALLRALFTLYQHWNKNFKRELYTDRQISGFPEWSAVIGGMLAAAGIQDFLVDTLQQIKSIEPWKETGAELAKAWYEGAVVERHGEETAVGGFGSAYRYVKEVFELGELFEFIKKDDSRQSKLQTLGNKLKKLRMVNLPGGYRFERDPDEKDGARWRVVKDAGSVR